MRCLAVRIAPLGPALSATPGADPAIMAAKEGQMGVRAFVESGIHLDGAVAPAVTN